MSLDNPEIARFIRRAMVARIATLSGSGRPSVTPLYFVMMDGHIFLGTSSWTLAAREISANPQVSVLFQLEDSPADRRVLRATGSARIRTDPATMRASNLRMALKYVLTPRGLVNQLANIRLFQLRRRYYAQSRSKGQPCVIDLTPAHLEFLTL